MEIVNRSNSTSTENHQINAYPSRDKNMAVAISMPTSCHSPTHNRDNKSPPRNSRSRATHESVKVVSDLQKDQKEEDAVTRKTGILRDPRSFEQDDDAHGGVPVGGGSLRNSPSSSKEMTDDSPDRRELQKLHR